MPPCKIARLIALDWNPCGRVRDRRRSGRAALRGPHVARDFPATHTFRVAVRGLCSEVGEVALGVLLALAPAEGDEVDALRFGKALDFISASGE
jgi:hypothetical protein